MAIKILVVVLRSIAAYVLMLVFCRFMGRKIISNITFFGFVVGVSLGSFTVHLAMDSDTSFLLCLISVAVIITLALTTDFAIIKSVRLQILIEGEPILLILDGKAIDVNLKKARVNLSKLTMMLRSKNMFNISDVQLAVFESNGELSVLPKPSKEFVTTGDMNIVKQAANMPVDIIIDGHVLTKNLENTGLDMSWLNNQLNLQNVRVKMVLYAGLDTSGNLYVCPRGQNN